MDYFGDRPDVIRMAMALLACALGACAGGKPGIILEKNLAEISIQELPRCKRVRLYKTPDGGVWIGNPPGA